MNRQEPLDTLHEALVETAVEPCAVLDDQGRVLAANEAMAKYLGVSRNDLTGTELFAFFPKQAQARGREALEAALDDPSPRELENTCPSGTECLTLLHPVAGEQTPSRVVVRIKDIAGPKRLEEQRVRLANALEQALEAILLLDNDFNIQYVNQSFQGLTGYSLKDAIGKNLAAFYKDEEQQRILEGIIACLGDNDAWVGRTHTTRRDGTRMECEQTFSRIRHRGGRQLGYVSVWRDVTELAVLERQLRQAQKMEAIGTLAGGLAHDFNNILGPIILYAEMGLQGLDRGNPLHESLAEILDAANRARNLVEQILGLSRQKEHDRPILFPLSSIVKECLKLLRPSLSPSVQVAFSNEAECDMLLADPTQIHQLLMNLCTNALHAISQDTGQLDIRITDEFVAFQASEYQPLQPGQYLRLEVCDNGHGIPAENIERIFDPFFTTKKDGKGTGLGLAVALNIATSLGGAMEVRSSPGEGAAFSVLLPVRTPAEGVLAPDCQGQKERLDGRLHILLVDDDGHTSCVGKQLLEELGHLVSMTRSPFEALALFRQNPDDYDLVIAEFEMPELGGIELVREMLLNRPELPVALCTNHSEAAVHDQAVSCGARCILRKPFLLQELRSQLEMLCPSMASQG